MAKKADTTDPVEVRCGMWPTHPLRGGEVRDEVNANLDDPLKINRKQKADTASYRPSSVQLNHQSH